jgi:BlaI family transcriptional regulator, penicillinase repressor
MRSETPRFSRRERQIMDIIYARGEATAADVEQDLNDAPSYSAVRALLRVLENKGFLQHREEGPRYVYLPTEPREKASRSALKNVLKTFFEGSLANAVSSLVDARDGKLSAEELKRLEAIIKGARKS